MCCRYQGGIFSPKKVLTSTNIHLRARSTFVNKQLKCILHNIADAQIKEAVFLITQRDAKRAAKGEITEAVRSFKTAASINRSSHYSRPLLWHSQQPVAFTENSSLKSCTSMLKSSKLKHFLSFPEHKELRRGFSNCDRESQTQLLQAALHKPKTKKKPLRACE